MRNNHLVWGVVLLLLGGLMLANVIGIRLPKGNSLTSLFWSLTLIFFGVWALASRFIHANVKKDFTNETI